MNHHAQFIFIQWNPCVCGKRWDCTTGDRGFQNVVLNLKAVGWPMRHLQMRSNQVVVLQSQMQSKCNAFKKKISLKLSKPLEPNLPCRNYNRNRNWSTWQHKGADKPRMQSISLRTGLENQPVTGNWREACHQLKETSIQHPAACGHHVWVWIETQLSNIFEIGEFGYGLIYEV